MNLLKNSNIDIRKPIDKYGNTFLHSVAESIHGKLVDTMISYSSLPLDINIKNSIGATPLHVAAKNDTEAVSMLLKYNADVNSSTKFGYTPLQYAVEYGCYKACMRLCTLERKIQKGESVYLRNSELNINWQNDSKETSLHLVIEARNVAAMQSKNKRLLNKCDDSYTRIVKLLLEIGVDVNIKNHDGDTPLHIATRYEMEYIVKLLLHYNANIHVRNKRNETVMDLTKKHSHRYVKNLFMVNKKYCNGE